MSKASWLAVVVACALASRLAHADHDGMVMGNASGMDSSSASSFDVSVAIEAASFSPSESDNMDYGGNYEGVLFGGDWSMGRWNAGASWSYYRIFRNGEQGYGIGDVMLHGSVALVTGHEVQAGVVMAAMVPTGDSDEGLGMGTTMLMPAVWGRWQHHKLALDATAGYSRGLTSLAISHGVLPTVDPMNMQELSWSASASYVAGTRWLVSARLSGGVPIDYAGSDRVIGTARLQWQSGTAGVITAAELQAGLAGDPFTVRGVLSTSMRF